LLYLSAASGIKPEDTLSSAKAYLEKAIQANPDMPPFMVHYVDGEFELNDGNHRHKACENLGFENAWVIIWITEEAELDDFTAKFGEYVKNCKVIRR